MARVKLTKRTIDSLPLCSKKTFDLYYDSELNGFGLKVFPSGKRVFFFEYGPRGKRRRMTLGAYGAITPVQARSIAKEQMASVIQGGDPLDERQMRREMPTVSAWIDTYLADAERRKKSVREDRRYLRDARKRWGSRPLDSLTAADIRKAMAEMSKDHPTRGNRWLASVRACLAAAWRLDIIGSNPAMKVKLNRESPPRSRVLGDDELKRVLAAIDTLEDIHARAAFHLLIATGARTSEVLRARWEDVDLENEIWRIPSPKAGRPQVVPLHRDIVVLLRDLPRVGPFVIPGRNPDKPRSDLKRPWATVRKLAKVPDVRLPDLRRTFGLHVTRSAGLHVASKLLRHADVRVTERVYAPLGLDDLRKGLDKTATARGKILSLDKARKRGRSKKRVSGKKPGTA